MSSRHVWKPEFRQLMATLGLCSMGRRMAKEKNWHDNKHLGSRKGVNSKNGVWSPVFRVCFETTGGGIPWELDGNADSQAPLRLTESKSAFLQDTHVCLKVRHWVSIFYLEENISPFRLWLWLLPEVWPWPCYKTSLHLSYFACRKGIPSPTSWSGRDNQQAYLCQGLITW